MTRPTLPTDIEALKDLVMTHYQRAAQEQLRANQEYQRAEMYKCRFENLVRKHFGSSSEKRTDTSGQQQLFELPAEPEIVVEKPAPDPSVEAAPEKKRHGGGRKPLPPELRRERREYTLPEEQRKCSCCNVPMQPFGEEISEQLEYIPSSLHVIEHVRIKYACKCCQEKPAIAPVPDKVIDKGLAGPGLLAWVAVSKYADHQPLYRQESIFARHGLEIARSTQCAWLGTVAELLLPIYTRMVDDVKRSDKIHTDDTPVNVLEPGRGKTRKARFWVYCQRRCENGVIQPV